VPDLGHAVAEKRLAKVESGGEAGEIFDLSKRILHFHFLTGCRQCDLHSDPLAAQCECWFDQANCVFGVFLFDYVFSAVLAAACSFCCDMLQMSSKRSRSEAPAQTSTAAPAQLASEVFDTLLQCSRKQLAQLVSVFVKASSAQKLELVRAAAVKNGALVETSTCASAFWTWQACGQWSRCARDGDMRVSMVALVTALR